MQLLEHPTRLVFSVQERNAAQRALLYLVTDFGLQISNDACSNGQKPQPLRHEWVLNLGAAQARIAVESQSEHDLKSPLPVASATCFLALNAAGAQLIELLYTSLRRTWRDPKNGPTHLRRIVNRQQAEAVLRLLR